MGKENINNNIVIDINKSIQLNSVKEVIESSKDRLLIILTSQDKLEILGKDIEVKNVDTSNGQFFAEGIIYSIKIKSSTRGSSNIKSRLFK